MKKEIRSILSIAVLAMLTIFYGCGGEGDGNDDPDKTVVELNTAILMSKAWTVGAVTVPANSATSGSDWDQFTVSFAATEITTSGHPVPEKPDDASTAKVWPSGAWSFTDVNATAIERADGVVMTFGTLNSTGWSVSFSLPDSYKTDGRVAALGGDYLFTFQ